MSQRARRLVMRLLLVVTTFGSVMGFNFTGNPAFVLLPFIAGVVMIVMVLNVRRKGYDPEWLLKNRRGGLIQLMICCCMVLGFLVYAIAQNNRHNIVGFALMLANLVLLLALGLWSYFRARSQRAVGCEEIRDSTRIITRDKR